MAEALLDELVEDILLRIPPDDPARLVRAALVCRRWRRLIFDPGFRRRFREFHRRPPLLGFLCSIRSGPAHSAADPFVLAFAAYSTRARFVPASSVARPAEHSGWHALDSRHGRVLLYKFSSTLVTVKHLAVWDPITDKLVEIPPIPQDPIPYYVGWNAAVLCAGVRGGCDHLDSHGNPFLVVFMFVGRKVSMRILLVRIYSSESRRWSEVTCTTPMPVPVSLRLDQPVLVGQAIYFMLRTPKILKYDLDTQKTSEIHFPDTFNLWKVVLMTTEDGGLGLAGVEYFKLSLWSWEAGSEKGASWAQTKVIELKAILPVEALLTSPHVLGVADGLGLIFVWTNAGLFTIDQKSHQVRRLGDVEGGSRIYNIVPHVSFCTPVSRQTWLPWMMELAGCCFWIWS